MSSNTNLTNTVQLSDNTGIYAPDAAAPHRTVAFFTKMGLRVHFDIETQHLELWINPQAGKDTDVFLRNFSNRDNHTRLFDEIFFPDLRPEKFLRSEYDALHTILHFEGVSLHMAQDPGVCGLRLWFDGAEQRVDFKADKQDSAGLREARLFSTSHPDRGLTLDFTAALGEGGGAFWHTPVVAPGRSVWARATLAPGQVLAIAGELASEPVIDTARSLAGASPDEFQLRVRTASATLDGGRITLGEGFSAPRRMERVLEINKRLLWSSVDASGIIWDSPRHIYSLPWVREGLSIPLAAWIGMPCLARDFARFALDNPAQLSDGRMYGQLFGPLSKWQEDGLFYVVSSVHAAWLAEPDGGWFEGGNLQTLLDALDWLTRRNWDEEKGLYWRYFACETPFFGSRDFGWDAAAGAPAASNPMRYEGKIIRRAYDIYINCLQYAVLRTLAPHVDATKRDRFLDMATRIDAGLAPLWKEGNRGLPPYGWVEVEDGTTFLAPELDWTDHIWGICLPSIVPPSMPVRRIRAEMARRATEEISNQGMSFFLFAYSIPWLAADPLDRPASETIADLDALLPEIEREPAYQRSPGAVPECVGVEDGDTWHDIRPCAFAVGQWLPVFHGLGLRRHHLSWSVRGGRGIAGIADMPLGGGATADIEFSPSEALCGVKVDGAALQHSLVLPQSVLTPGRHRVEVGGKASPGPILVATDARLLEVKSVGGEVRYRLAGLGPHRLEFADGSTRHVEIDGETVIACSSHNIPPLARSTVLDG